MIKSRSVGWAWLDGLVAQLWCVNDAPPRRNRFKPGLRGIVAAGYWLLAGEEILLKVLFQCRGVVALS
ncbi:unnamed protein product [Discula destructiva]